MKWYTVSLNYEKGKCEEYTSKIAAKNNVTDYKVEVVSLQHWPFYAYRGQILL